MARYNLIILMSAGSRGMVQLPALPIPFPCFKLALPQLFVCEFSSGSCVTPTSRDLIFKELEVIIYPLLPGLLLFPKLQTPHVLVTLALVAVVLDTQVWGPQDSSVLSFSILSPHGIFMNFSLNIFPPARNRTDD
ncbi:hypothetical protein P167DRAFT_124812 [Morchella conica CCBAS932]|uniref:Uncharacterized protein n=1 Tax=Morchella conica CCBAS932 TaxID=1392247 RepID=A0A3N4L332_9PEZI|nr:hypothetical protein P167DRAFT_124812 [Morchella conica CCBAS932]